MITIMAMITAKNNRMSIMIAIITIPIMIMEITNTKNIIGWSEVFGNDNDLKVANHNDDGDGYLRDDFYGEHS